RGAEVTVRVSVAVFVKAPEVPVMVTEAVPVVAVPLAVSVKVLVAVAGLGLNTAVTPTGRPDADRLTAPLKPFWGVTVIVLVPPAPCAKVKVLGEVESVKLGGVVTLKAIVAVFVKLPDVPVMVTVAVPVVAVLLAVSVKVLVEDAGLGVNVAVTPLGRLEADRVTAPVNPFCGVTVIVLVPLAPCVIPRLLGEAESVKVPAAPTVNVSGLLQFMLGATETDSGPEVAPAGIVIVIEVAPQVSIVASIPFSVTMLLPCEAPNPVPEITTWLPTGPAVADRLVITGAGAGAEFTDTLSNVAVASAELFPLVTASPMYTFAAMLIVWLVPICTQFTPSEET